MYLPAAAPTRLVAQVALAGNERESCQIVVLPLPGDTLRRVKVAVSGLVCKATGARIEARHVEWHQVGYVRIEQLFDHPGYPEAAPGWWPDPLLTVDAFDVPSGRAQPLWVTVRSAPRG